jgi:hypothetical protein
MTWKALDQTWHYVEKWATEHPDKEALVFGEERLTWLDFKKQMDLIARHTLTSGSGKETGLRSWPWRVMNSSPPIWRQEKWELYGLV